MATVFQKCKSDEDNKNYPCDKARCGHPWTVRYRENGGRSGRQREKTFPKKTGPDGADAFATKVENDKLEGIVSVQRPKYTLKAWGDKWLGGRMLSDRIRRDYEWFFENRLYAQLGQDTDMAAIPPSDLQAFVVYLQECGYEPRTIADWIAKIRGMFNAAVAEEVRGTNPAADPKAPLALPRVSGRAVDDDEIPSAEHVWLIADAIEPTLKLAVLAQSGAGMRLSESLALGPTTVRGGDFRIRWQTSYETEPRLRALKHRAEGEYRDSPAAPSLLEELDAHTRKYGCVRRTAQAGKTTFHEEVAIHRAGGKLLNKSHFQYYFFKAQKKTGLVTPDGKPLYHPHHLRHFYASTALANKVPILNVSRWLGHRSIQVTGDIYGHLVPAMDLAAKLALEAALWAE
ncbi:tyrosine-type recombinase/integrase [Nocardia arthritidis]|uniref:Tyrosine-type recombinase/integrase n=1 Tax=Nocardia arthritidis TaxID=228602 RepID=A0A6G9YT98_9NOCA|nr:tyrosine-type recombinase/integrase [Nocardia arthritidis]QIS16438.1 tyrosine-type recombinase/integrase [Nocardia arthritidis]QIS16451.1 tyrosine-type recombinase/integrase [Nocardia arthritidis]